MKLLKIKNKIWLCVFQLQALRQYVQYRGTFLMIFII